MSFGQDGFDYVQTGSEIWQSNVVFIPNGNALTTGTITTTTIPNGTTTYVFPTTVGGWPLPYDGEGIQQLPWNQKQIDDDLIRMLSKRIRDLEEVLDKYQKYDEPEPEPTYRRKFRQVEQ